LAKWGGGAFCHGRQPCWKLGHRFDHAPMAARIVRNRRSGWYYRVIEEGVVQVGDALTLVEPGHAEWPVDRLFHVLIGGGHKADPGVLSDLAAMPRLLPPPLDRGAKPDRLAIFGHRAAGQFKALVLQEIDQRIVGQDLLGILIVDQVLDRGLDRLGGDRALAIGAGHAAGEEIFQLERAAIAEQIFVAGDAADGRFVQSHRLGHRAQGQRLQLADPVAEKAFLLAHQFAGHFQAGFLPLVQRLDQPAGIGQLFRQPAAIFLARAVFGSESPAHFQIIAEVEDQSGQRSLIERHVPACIGARTT
ncbi:hypothetical protein E4T56_gene13624, partial [Termitomyces sp. T112]